MASFWPTPAAAEQFPAVAKQMTRLQKVVFLEDAGKGDLEQHEAREEQPGDGDPEMKSEPGEQMVVMGSGTIASQLAQADLIDEYQLVVIPVVLGEGTTMFEGSKRKLPLTLIRSRTFRNGSVPVYQPKD